MRTRALCLLLFASLLAPSGEAAAEADKFTLDPDHTSVLFLVNHQGFSRVIGRFREFSGGFVFDQQNPAAASVSVSIKTASVDTNAEKRDQHLRSPDFFNAREFPEMKFESTSLSLESGSGKLIGNLTLLGVTKPITLDLTVNRIAPHPRDPVLVAGFSARGTFKRSDFGMKYGLGGISDEVEIWLEVEGGAPRR